MKFKGEFSLSPSDWHGACAFLHVLTGGGVDEPEQDSPGGQFFQVLPTVEYRFRQSEDGEVTVSTGKHIRPGDTIIHEDGGEFVVTVVAVRRNG